MPGVGPQQGPDPDYPVPWTTNVPREGLREEIKARVICLSPSVNLTPSGGGMVPVPYMIYDECDHPENFSAKTFYTRRRVLRMCSKTSHVHGDEAGTGGGVASGTHGSVCEPISHAAKVRVEGSEVARHLDRFWMNNRNTVGEAVFARDMTIHAAPDDTDPLPGSARVILAGMQSSAAASPQTAPAPQPEPRPSQPLPRPPAKLLGRVQAGRLSGIAHHPNRPPSSRPASCYALAGGGG